MNEKLASTESRATFILALQKYGLFQDKTKYKVVCPFHGDANPSLMINLDTAYFYCFGCGVHGSTYELLQAFNPGKNALEIARELRQLGRGAKKVNVDYTPVKPSIDYILQAKNYFYNLPKVNWLNPPEDGQEAKRYMLNRGFSSISLNNFHAKATYNTYYPIAFPLLENGRFKGYILRTTLKEVEEKRKYLYNKGFTRSSTLPGVYHRSKPIVLVEGYLDCLAARTLGVENVGALLGWKISREQIQILLDHNITTIISALDNDEAGRSGYKYLKQIQNQYGFTVLHLIYPKGIKDFGDLLKNRSQAKLVLAQLKKFK